MAEKCKLAVFTTVYPEGTKYLSDWHKSILAQTDCDFDLWIGCDKICIEDVQRLIGSEIDAYWMQKEKGESAIYLRERMIREITEDYSIVVFVDSDDILMPSRVQAARSALQFCDFYGCSMKLINEFGLDLNCYFHPPKYHDLSKVIIRNNIFGLSNTAYQTNLLDECLPFPKDCILLDWFLATRAFNNNKKPYFDSEVQMLYRQHSLNTARILPPFSGKQVLLSTKLVLDHYQFVLSQIPDLSPEYNEQILIAQEEVHKFFDIVSTYKDILNVYVHALNSLPVEHIWWSCVANPQLEGIWRN